MEELEADVEVLELKQVELVDVVEEEQKMEWSGRRSCGSKKKRESRGVEEKRETNNEISVVRRRRRANAGRVHRRM